MELSELSVLLADQLKLNPLQIRSILELNDEGCTVPFMARYRKERTFNSDEEVIRRVLEAHDKLTKLEKRRDDIISTLKDHPSSSPELLAQVYAAQTLSQLEELYRPYKRKIKTKAMIAREAGWGELAQLLMTTHLSALEKALREVVQKNPEYTYNQVLEGAQDIAMEVYFQDLKLRGGLLPWLRQFGKISSKKLTDSDPQKAQVYQLYWDFQQDFKNLKPHQVLALDRGEGEKILDLQISPDSIEKMENRWIQLVDPPNLHGEQAARMVLKKSVFPSLVRELWSQALENAETHSLKVFATNLKNLLLQPPIRGRKILSLDPGLRTGCKATVLDPTGKCLDHFVLDVFKPDQALIRVKESLNQHSFELVALGSGTGSQEAQKILEAGEIPYCLVDEDGASVYSASPLAKKELPQLDVTFRGAVSIGRRLMDPLAELVKIDPASLGVGQYQHDLSATRMKEHLNTVVESVVNQVGVLVNTASPSLLAHVSGIGPSLAEKIVEHRSQVGTLKTRKDLLKVPGMGPKTFEQAAGFLKIPESKNPLDNTWVHPESYPLAKDLIQLGKVQSETRESSAGTLEITESQLSTLASKHSVSLAVVKEVFLELKKPSRDPRLDFDPPPIRTHSTRLEDLKPGQQVQGRVKNVVDFGAFIDIGTKESALIHVSEMSDSFVKDPHSVLKVGDKKDFRVLSLDIERKRISLTLKNGNTLT